MLWVGTLSLAYLYLGIGCLVTCCLWPQMGPERCVSACAYTECNFLMPSTLCISTRLRREQIAYKCPVPIHKSKLQLLELQLLHSLQRFRIQSHSFSKIKQRIIHSLYFFTSPLSFPFVFQNRLSTPENLQAFRPSEPCIPSPLRAWACFLWSKQSLPL